MSRETRDAGDSKLVNLEQQYAPGAAELIELYITWRARGIKLESPAVRP